MWFFSCFWGLVGCVFGVCVIGGLGGFLGLLDTFGLGFVVAVCWYFVLLWFGCVCRLFCFGLIWVLVWLCLGGYVLVV